MHQLAGRAPLDLNATHVLPAQWMPAIVNNDILPDMGRMTVRLRSPVLKPKSATRSGQRITTNTPNIISDRCAGTKNGRKRRCRDGPPAVRALEVTNSEVSDGVPLGRVSLENVNWNRGVRKMTDGRGLSWEAQEVLQKIKSFSRLPGAGIPVVQLKVLVFRWFN
jgi:hypothetical protein